MPISAAATSGSTVPASGCCRPIAARSRLDLPEPDGPNRLAAIGNRQIADAQISAPNDRCVVQPRHAGTGLEHAAGEETLFDPFGGLDVDRDSVGIERSAVAGDD